MLSPVDMVIANGGSDPEWVALMYRSMMKARWLYVLLRWRISF